MSLRASIRILAVAAPALMFMTPTVQADVYEPAPKKVYRVVKKHAHYHAPAPVHHVHHTAHHERRFCLFDWFRNRHHHHHAHAAPAYHAAPAKVVYAKKVYAKKVAYAPLK